MKNMNRRNFIYSAGIAAAVPTLGTMTAEAQQAPQQAAPSNVRVESDVVFGKGGDMDLRLDIYHPPAGTEKRMAVIHLHGGGFTGGSKTGVASSSRAFSGIGYLSIASQYRLTGQGRWPAQIEDTKAAIRWTRANASRLNIDPNNIAIAGYSAGGLMALFAAATSDRKEFEGNGGNAGISSKAAACVAFYPAVNANAALLPEGSDRAAIDAASPGNHISATFAPTIFLHGAADTTIRPQTSLDFYNKLVAANVKADLHFFQGAPHGYEIANADAALLSAQLANLFFERLILNPREYPPFGGGGRGDRGGGGGARGGGGGAPRGGGAPQQ
jgi:acetyl esterase/lipase